MKYIPNNLSTAYRKILKSPILQGEVTDAEVTRFEELLNKALPTSQDNYDLFLFVKELFHNNKNKFLKFIENSEYNCFILWTENKTIMNRLNLRKKVYVKWNPETKQYVVERYTEQTRDPDMDVDAIVSEV